MQTTEITWLRPGTRDALSRVMMHKLLPLTALALGLSGGAAFADRGHDHRGGGDSRHSNTNVVVRDHGGGRSNVVVREHGGGRGNTVVVREHNDYRGGYRG